MRVASCHKVDLTLQSRKKTYSKGLPDSLAGEGGVVFLRQRKNYKLRNIIYNFLNRNKKFLESSTMRTQSKLFIVQIHNMIIDDGFLGFLFRLRAHFI